MPLYVSLETKYCNYLYTLDSKHTHTNAARAHTHEAILAAEVTRSHYFVSVQIAPLSCNN